MYKATGYSAGYPRFRTTFGLVRLEYASYNHDRGDTAPQWEVIARLCGPFGALGKLRFYRCRWDEDNWDNSARLRDMQPDFVDCADRIVKEFLAQKPDWLKAGLKKWIEQPDFGFGPLKKLSSGDVSEIQTAVRSCIHFSRTFDEPTLGKSLAQWTDIDTSIDQFTASNSQHGNAAGRTEEARRLKGDFHHVENKNAGDTKALGNVRRSPRARL